MKIRLACIATSLVVLAGAAAAQPPPPMPAGPPSGEVMMSVPGERFENVIVAADGSLYATGVLGGKVMRRAPDGTVSTFVTRHSPQGIIETSIGYLIDYQLRDPDFASGRLSLKGLGARLDVVNKAGKTLQTLEGPDDAAFFNGMDLARPTMLLIGDTGGDRILHADLSLGTVVPWFTPPPREGPAAGPAGVNGLKVRNGWVYFARGDIYRVKIGANGQPDGGMEMAAQTRMTDDFDVADDGTIYASHGGEIVKITPTGQSSVVVPSCPSCTSTRISPDGKWLYFTGGAIPRPGAPKTAGYVSRVGLR